MNTRWVACVVISFGAAVAFAQAPGQPITTSGTRNTVTTSPPAGHGPVMKWEYAVHGANEVTKLGGGQLDAGLNKLGDEGWELLSVTGAAHGSTYYFKRARGPMPMAGMGMGMAAGFGS